LGSACGTLALSTPERKLSPGRTQEDNIKMNIAEEIQLMHNIIIYLSFLFSFSPTRFGK
jgi:hypothetical protein